MPIIAGGPNIRFDNERIGQFLSDNNFIDIYITFEGESPFSKLLKNILK